MKRRARLGWVGTWGIAALVLLLVAGCRGAPRVRGAGGLEFEELRIGSGPELKHGQHAAVHYTAWLGSGRQFDSTRERGLPFEFVVGADHVIEGMNRGVAGMRKGGKRKLIIPPGLAYGEAGTPNGLIPRNATLVYEVELLEIRE